MLAGVLLALIGTADVVRTRTGTDAAPRRVLTVIVVLLLWIGMAVVAVPGLGLPVGAVATAIVLAALWIATTTPVRPTDARPSTTPPRVWWRRSGSWPSVLLAVALAVLLLTVPSVDPSGFVVEWQRGSAPAFVAAVPLAAIVGGVGAALFLVDSANVVVAQALPPGLSPDTVGRTVEDGRGRRLFARRPRRDARDAEPAGDDDTGAGTVLLQGGRMIGPIERLLLAGFSLVGAFPVVAALIAAKGIVRFPEIRRETTGYQAEYFLIGSLVSWAMAFAAAGMCWLLAQG
ncbi:MULTISPECIES: hypothetical protein [unclassified Curtobacterium]|jgi:hypothetical protein|uniref:hypothetical protein n=1 Tax=unclassified Curtobacterium TaxID=257496 RepID=UPI0008DDFF03|nr:MULTISPECIES: hypothetical protein [unclassified Curtobacterium]MCT9621922.1 hypothetical protein [Curtobacterium sp. C2H10]OII25325.1 hypothetical protein BIV03_08905 [Curtobacterium sp. MCBA15_016]